MRVVHEPPGGDARTLAVDVETADSWRSKTLGLMFRPSVPDGYALVFPFDRVGRRAIHTVGVRVPIDVVWTAEGEVVRAETLPAWRGAGVARADRVVEFPAGAADGVVAGDRLRVVEEG
ncbi:DUF192 domain-containing protein [Halobacteriales archaeon QS_8_69_26]|nr:MAG: DUF192 domain-containing protein [Halobacteriales archaeon QS_8_69_26]